MYETLKIIHITSVVVWMGGMIVASAIPNGDLSDKGIQNVRLLLTIGIVGTWVAGLILAQQGGWFSSPWLHAKLALVTLLSGLHGVVVARLRGRNYASSESLIWTSLPWAMTGAVFLVAYLVIFKPF